MDTNGFLKRVRIVTPDGEFLLGRAGAAAGDDGTGRPRRSLAAEAMRWTRILKSRARWNDDPAAVARNQDDAAGTLHAFGLGDDALQALARSAQVVVAMPFTDEATGWEGRIFPWEFVIASATRRFRGERQRLTVMRQLDLRGAAVAYEPSVLFVQSFPAPLASLYSANSEAAAVRRALCSGPGARWRLLVNPSLDELRGAVLAFRPQVVHLCGFDNHQGLQLLHEHDGGEDGVRAGTQASPGQATQQPVRDGYLLRDASGGPPIPTPAEDLARALTAGGAHRPHLVGLNLWNSAARTAPLLVAAGARACIGFQDAFDDALGEYFFETFYSHYDSSRGDVPAAFQRAWQAVRRQDDLPPSTGVALWGGSRLLGPAPRQASAAVTVEIEAPTEINPSALAPVCTPFDRFVLSWAAPRAGAAKVEVRVALVCGATRLDWQEDITLTEPRMDLAARVRFGVRAALREQVLELGAFVLQVVVLVDGRRLDRGIDGEGKESGELFPIRLRSAPAVEVDLKALDEVNYSVLHNGGALFEEFVLRSNATALRPLAVQIEVVLNFGRETARFESELLLEAPRRSVRDEIKVPLTATLIRSLGEAVASTLFVHVRCEGASLIRRTHPLRLLPVDQWLDNRTSGNWLPSFVLPRDPAVEAAVTLAQRYVRVIRDEPSAGFEGYQATLPGDAASLESVDLQVEAIWSALLHEWKLGYVNPPPTYSKALDSQRLRTPSAILATRMGTCIDLALLFAACLELVDIHPVVFLLEGHALPGYWRSGEFQQAWSAGRAPAPASEPTAQAEASGLASARQAPPWRVDDHREIGRLIRARQLVPIETVRLTEFCGFGEAVQAGREALANAADFDSMLDIVTARLHKVTPLPITRERA